MEYLPRTVDDELDELLSALPAVAVEGPKGVGKTVTALQRCRSVVALDEPFTREVFTADPGALRRAEPPVLIDEWQRYPPVWDAVRREVDRDRSPGRFLLTGSATPPPDAAIHSGAGRIVTVRLRPLTLQERGVHPAPVSLGALVAGGRSDVRADCRLGLPDYVEEVMASGLPGLRGLHGRARGQSLDSYLDRVVDRDFAEQGLAIRQPATLRRWMQAYAAATATTARHQSILDAATPGESDKPARSTVTAYRDILRRLWLLDPVPGWTPMRNELTRLQQAPKHHLADPALAARLLGVTSSTLLSGQGRTLRPGNDSLIGALFESLATLCVRVAAQAAHAQTYHLRTRDGDHEVDLVVEREDRKVLAVEVKLSGDVGDRDVRHLLWLRSRLGADFLDGVVLTSGPYAYRRRDGILVLPLGLLGA